MLQELTMTDIWRALRAHRTLAIKVFAATMGLVLIGIALSPRAYFSEAKLFVRLGKESVALDPSATTGQTVAVYESRESEIRSVSDMLLSRAVLEHVVDQLGPDAILHPQSGPAASADQQTAQGPAGGSILSMAVWPLRASMSLVGITDPVTSRELAIQELISSTYVDRGAKSSVLTVGCTSKSPMAAQQIVDACIDAYRAVHVQANSTPQSYGFFEEQSALLKQQVQEAESELRDAKNELGMASLSGRQADLQFQLNDLEIKLRVAQAALSATEAEIMNMQSSIAAMPERIVTDQVSGFAHSAADSMRENLYELELRAEELKARYTEKHPNVIAVMQQIEQSKEILSRQEPQRTQVTQTVNPSVEHLRIRLADQQTRAASLRAESTALAGQRSQVRTELAELNDAEVRIAQLERRIQLAAANYQQYAESFELARIGQALDTERISNVNIVQAPTYVAKPISPNKRLIFAFGLVLATLNGSFAAVAKDRQNRRHISARAPTRVYNGTNGDVPRESRSNGHHQRTEPNGEHRLNPPRPPISR